MYRVLAWIYSEPPSADLVSALAACAASPLMNQVFAAPAVEELRWYAAPGEWDIEMLRQEFQDLFMVPLGRYVAPYEAVYRDERIVGEERVRGLLMGPSTLAVMAMYRQSGVRVSPDCAELPDHVGIELTFMSLLCEREQQSWNVGDQPGVRATLRDQERFLIEHLLRWLPALSSRIRQNARTDFYRGIACLTAAFLESDAAAVAQLLRAIGPEDGDPHRSAEHG